MDLSIVIVNWNSTAYLRACLGSVRAHVHGLAYEIVVVDSGSFDGCGQMLESEYPDVTFIQARSNIGFARANNAAFAASTGRHVLFLNPDTQVVDDAIPRMLAALRQLPGAGAIGCRLLNTDGSLQTTCLQPLPTILNQLLDAEWLRARSPRSRLWGTAPLFTAQTAPIAVPALSGACVMVQRSAFEAVGGFGEEYFMYAEDVDLCAKLARGGHGIYLLPDAAIVHHGGGSSGTTTSTFASVMLRDSIWRFLRKTRGAAYARAFRGTTLLAALARLIVLVAMLPALACSGRTARWAASMRKWAAIFAWTLRARAPVPR